MISFDPFFALRALHEREGDAQGGPAVLEELKDAVCMEYVAAAQLNAWLFLELTRVADAAQLFIVG